ncbi:MAG: hypothetical protein LC772_01620, partial [Chloroflexi bacterium]|nr:hypothetical protein [Chloroflexota bacterium]
MKSTQTHFLFAASLLALTGFWSPAATAPLPGSIPLPGAVSYTLGDGGLSSLKYGGQEFLGAEGDGAIAVDNPVTVVLTAGREAPSDSVKAAANPRVVTEDAARQSVRLGGSWGWVMCGYGARGDRLNLQVTVHNAAPVPIKMAPVRLMELTFPGAPECTELDAGQFGRGGVPRPLHDYPAVADPRAAPPIVFIDYGTGSLAFCSDY